MKLVVFDKGTLTEPRGGTTFVQHPEDQQLRSGVARKLEQLRADGWAMAIVSNEGGSAVFEVVAEDIKPGMSIDFDGEWTKVFAVDRKVVSGGVVIETSGGFYLIAGSYNARWKTIEEECAEMVVDPD